MFIMTTHPWTLVFLRKPGKQAIDQLSVSQFSATVAKRLERFTLPPNTLSLEAQ
jgi:hypothetical protein